MNFRHKKLVAMLALASQGLGGFGGFAAKAGAAEASDEAAETVVSIGFSLNEADSDSVPLPETGDETGPASRTVPRAAKLGIPLVGGAALLAGLAAFVGHKLFSSGKSVEGEKIDPIPSDGKTDPIPSDGKTDPIPSDGKTDPIQTTEDASPSYSLTRDLEGKPHESLALWYEFLLNYYAEAGKHIVICGPSGSGKTYLINQLDAKNLLKTISTEDTYRWLLGDRSKATLIEELKRVCEFDSFDNRLAGTTDLVVLVLDYSCQNFKTNLVEYLECLASIMLCSSKLMVVLNKRDLLCVAVSNDDIKAVIKAKIKVHEWLLYEASAKTGESNLLAWSGDGHAPAAPAASA